MPIFRDWFPVLDLKVVLGWSQISPKFERHVPISMVDTDSRPIHRLQGHDQLKMNPKCNSDTIVVSIRSHGWQRNLPSVIVSHGIARWQQSQIIAFKPINAVVSIDSIESVESSSTLLKARWSYTWGRAGDFSSFWKL